MGDCGQRKEGDTLWISKPRLGYQYRRNRVILDRATLERLYVADELSTRQVATKLNVSKATVGEWLTRYGLTRNLSEAWAIAKKTGRRSPVSPRRGTSKHITNKEGYVMIRLFPEDPFFSMATKNGYVMEHRLVMAKRLGRPLHSWESVHHKNGTRSDNRLNNLLLVLKGGHQGRVKCPFCDNEFGVR